MTDTTPTPTMDELKQATDKAIAEETQALKDAKDAIKPIFEELHHTSKFEILQFLHSLARIEKERFY